MNDYTPHPDYTVANSAATDRATFIRQTYLHVAGAVGAFVVLEAMLLATPLAPALANMMIGRWSWLIVLGLFMFVSHIATKWASTATSVGGQYAGLGLYVVAEVIILCPLLLLASRFGEGLILKAGLITGGLFIGLTWVAFTSGKDFSFMAGFLKIAGFVALGTILVSMIFGFSLGTWFSGAMILLVGGCILYQTSNVIHHYHPNQYVAASLALFASIATLFWYVLQMFMSSRD